MASAKEEEGEEAGLQDHWYLVDAHGQKLKLPKTMLFLGREECDVVVASQSVDKRHAVLTFDLYLNRFKLKDLSTTNGTYVNNSRIPEQQYITLNHMDSIRLGQDAMMYHIEQGSQLSNLSGQPPDTQYIPSWGCRPQDSATIHVHAHAHAMAECQGCIAEQNLEHTCSLRREGKSSDAATQAEIAVSKQNTHHQQENNRDQHNHSQEHPVDIASNQSQHHDCSADHHHHKCQSSGHKPFPAQTSSDTSLDKKSPDTDQSSVPHSTSGQPASTTTATRNTWPRKRQLRQIAPASSVFTQAASENPDSTSSEAYPAGAVQTMFFVTFDDSVCNASNTSPNSESGKRPQSNTQLLQSELATVKKGTPLYGQPSWWGEGEGDAAASSSSSTDAGDNAGTTKNSRPSSLGLRRSDNSDATKSRTVSKTGRMENDKPKPHLSHTYMEIPIKDDDSPEVVDKSKDIPTPAKSMSSSLSKDSLSVSPELKQPNKNARVQSPGAELNPSMSFTIDLDDPERPPKKSLNIGSSISEFVPSKIRKNFRERKAISSKTSSKESTPSKNSEERELSPISQNKLDEIWGTVVEGRGKSRLSSMQATAGASLRSPNLEEIDRLSEFSDERRSLERDSDRKGLMKRPASNKSPQISSKATLSSSARTSSVSPATHSRSITVSQYPDSTSYLIDRMFEGGGSSTAHTDKELSPEQRMFREAAIFDRMNASNRSLEKCIVRPVIDPTSCHHSATRNALKSASVKTVNQAVVHDDVDDDDDLRITEDIPSNDNGLVEKDDKEDKASEAGTYTIEADMKEGQEEEEARKRIDQVFGVDVENFNSDQPVIDPLRLASPGGYDNVYDANDGDKTPLDENGQSPADDNIDLTVNDDYDGESTDMTATDGVQVWVNQLTALTNQKSADISRIGKEDGESSLSKKPPQGISRTRPGTGRKLPSIPSDKSPVCSEHGSHTGDQDLTTGDDVHIRTPDHTPNGRNSAGKSGINSSQPRSRTTNNGLPASPSTSSRTRGSVDTEVLLQDTATVMAAMQARISYRSGHGKKNSQSQDSDTDASSTIALVNGDESYVKPTQFKSPRDALAKRQKNELPTKPSNTSSATPLSPGRRPVALSYPQAVASKQKTVVSSPGSTPSSGGTRRSLVSDVFSRRDSVDNDSIISDVSSDVGEGNLSRSSSKGKGAIAMTRTNKTFDLRRARVDSFEEPATTRSARSSAPSKSSGASTVGRSHSLHSSTRNRSLALTNRSEATSLGTQIVKKSQNNITQEKARKTNTAASRTDSGIHNQNQRMQRASSLTISHPPPSSTATKREPTPKSHQRLTPTGKAGLTITGISNVSSKSQSQPGSRSNSPKAAEKMAWKRRKEYDARKSVAEAKAGKTKDNGGAGGVTMRPKPASGSNIQRRMIRSASFTNSAGLSLGVHSAASNSQDFSQRRDSYGQHEDFRRAFIPFHNSHRSDRSTHSADEDDSLASANSAQTSYDSLIVASIYQLSLKLKTSTDKTLNRLRDQNRVSHTPSPIDDFLSDSSKSEITAWKTANQELAGTLKNLRKLERHVQMMNTVIFPDTEVNSEVLSAVPAGRHVKQKLLEDIERKFGFQPIDHPRPDESDFASPEMAEFSGQF